MYNYQSLEITPDDSVFYSAYGMKALNDAALHYENARFTVFADECTSNTGTPTFEQYTCEDNLDLFDFPNDGTDNDSFGSSQSSIESVPWSPHTESKIGTTTHCNTPDMFIRRCNESSGTSCSFDDLLYNLCDMTTSPGHKLEFDKTEFVGCQTVIQTSGKPRVRVVKRKKDVIIDVNGVVSSKKIQKTEFGNEEQRLAVLILSKKLGVAHPTLFKKDIEHGQCLLDINVDKIGSYLRDLMKARQKSKGRKYPQYDFIDNPKFLAMERELLIMLPKGTNGYKLNNFNLCAWYANPLSKWQI